MPVRVPRARVKNVPFHSTTVQAFKSPLRQSMDPSHDAAWGTDLLGLALGRVPGGSDLDEAVDFAVYFDGTRKADSAGEALAFLRARLCDVFEVLSPDLDRYLWHRDRFLLEIDFGSHEEAHLMGHLRTGDCVEDEWFVVYLLKKLSTARADVACRVTDTDGELLLIEAALAVPRWLSPSNAENRCWLRGGQVHLLPKPTANESEKLSVVAGLARLRVGGGTIAKAKVQQVASASLVLTALNSQETRIPFPLFTGPVHQVALQTLCIQSSFCSIMVRRFGFGDTLCLLLRLTAVNRSGELMIVKVICGSRRQRPTAIWEKQCSRASALQFSGRK